MPTVVDHGGVTVGYDGGLGVVTIDRPPFNLLDAALTAGLVSALDELEALAPRAVLFRFEGPIVTGGADVALFDALPDTTAATELFTGLVALAQRVAAFACPTVFAAHQTCLTWGFELALACDIVLATDRASFGLVEATVGLTPAMGGTQRLAERVGSGRARELVMTADRYDAATMHAWGVVNRVLPVAGFDDAARTFARKLADGPTVAHAATKKVINAYLEGGVAQADAEMPSVVGALFDTRDLRGALRSFRTEGPGRATFDGR